MKIMPVHNAVDIGHRIYKILYSEAGDKGDMASPKAFKLMFKKMVDGRFQMPEDYKSYEKLLRENFEEVKE